MHRWIIIAGLAVALFLGAAYFWRRSRRLARELRRLTMELVESQRRSDELGSLVALEHQTNYRLACKLYGKAAVDRAMRGANEKGRN